MNICKMNNSKKKDFPFLSFSGKVGLTGRLRVILEPFKSSWPPQKNVTIRPHTPKHWGKNPKTRVYVIRYKNINKSHYETPRNKIHYCINYYSLLYKFWKDKKSHFHLIKIRYLFSIFVLPKINFWDNLPI